ncbi:MAG: hypothetical protein H5T83_02540 [Actinotalea sp.]|nr:hypothetical protein [Actinotalea sp.]
MTAPTTTARDRRRVAWYLFRLDLALQGFPRAEARQIQEGLRADLDDAVMHVGAGRALHDLGSPRQLAARYEAERGRPVPRVLDGAVAAFLVGAGITLSWLSYVLGAIDTLSTQGGGTVELSYLALPLTAWGGPNGLGFDVTLNLPSLMLLAVVLAVAFAVGARLWRLLPGVGARPTA